MTKKTFVSAFLFLFVSAFLISCGDNDSTKPTTSGMNTQPISIKQFDTPPGADPSVSAEMGGNGFTGEGWTTSTEYNTIGDPKAVKGGQIIWSIPDFPSTLRSVGKDENSYYTRMAQTLMYESLLDSDPVNEDYTPRLATHWQISEDQKVFKFRINPNARWADGKPVIADDYIATFKLLLDPGLLTGGDEYYKENFEIPVAESKYIVSIKATKVGWLYFASASGIRLLPAHIIGNISGKEYLEKFNYDCVPGSGPYYIKKEDIDKGRSIILRRRSDYWAEKEKFAAGLFNFDIIKTDVISDETLTYEKFKKGEIDIYSVNRAQWWAEKTDFEEVKRGIVQKRKIYNQNPGGLSGIVMNMRKPPFDDIKVRKAFSMLYDRKTFNEKLFFNSYTPIKSHFSGTVYENPNNPVVNYNLDSAILLLEEAGWRDKNQDGYRMKDGKIFEIEMTFTQPSQERYFTIFQEDLKKAGVKLNLKQVDGTTSFKIGNERSFSLIPANWGGQNPPNLEFNVTSKTADDPNSTNWSGQKNARIDEIADLYAKTFDKKERIKQVREVDSILVSMQPYIYGWYADYSRILFQNKFGYPKWYLSRFDDYYGGKELGVFAIWWLDPERYSEYQAALKDKGKNMIAGEVEEKFWIDLKAREEKGEVVMINK
ncbi:MAG: ABC transporter substrate-binding protein [Ignavibacteria bacterium]|nr:ABC transporter substrate-binding protein [Ignavibacteria bacterium]